MKRNQSKALMRPVSSSLRLCLALGVVGVFASVGSAASTAKDTYYVNDHLATTVATADAAGEIAQIEADAFGTQAGPVAKDSRFTGKPYDADMGAYVFPFRNYRSDEARWMSTDPSGFPDGSNASAYAPNPLSQLDASGLWSTNIHNSIIAYWLGSGYSHYNWAGHTIDVISAIEYGSAITDSLQYQGSGSSFMHGMSDPSINQTAAQASVAWTNFMSAKEGDAMNKSDDARAHNYNVDLENGALKYLGMAIHALSDSYSPAHTGFQPWYDPVHYTTLSHPDITFSTWAGYLSNHENKEGVSAYTEALKGTINSNIESMFRGALNYILRE